MADPTLEELMGTLGPKKTTGDEGSIEERSTKELILAAEFLAKQNRPTTPPYGLRLSKCQFQGMQS